VDELIVAVVGCGFVADGHLRAWTKVEKADVVAVCDVNKDAVEKTASLWKIGSRYTSFSKLLEHRNLGTIDICTPPHTHSSLAIQAMKSGFNVLLEKPMTMTSKDSEEIVKSQKETGVKAGVIHNWLFEPSVLEATSLVRRGYLGDIINVEIEALKTRKDEMAANKDHWCHKFPGGRFSEMLAHPIYLTRHFLGNQLTVEDVFVSKVGDYTWMKSDELVATFRVGKNWGRAYASFNAARDAIFINLYGEEGLLRLDVVNATLNVLPTREAKRFGKGFDSLRQAGQLVNCTAKNAVSVALGRWRSGHQTYIRMFADSLLNNRDPPVTVEDGCAVVKVLEEMCNKIDAAEKRNGLI